MVKAKRLNAMNLKVRDLTVSARWYREHFGLEPQYDVDGGVVIANGNIELVLSPHAHPNAPLADPRTVRCIHTLGIEVSQAEFQRAREEFDDDPEIVDIDQTEFRSFITADPDGYCIEIFYNKRRRGTGNGVMNR